MILSRYFRRPTLGCVMTVATTCATALTCTGAFADGVNTPWGEVLEPSLPADACMTLHASIQPIKGSIDHVDADPSKSQPDTARIQEAIDQCPSGQAVKLMADGDRTGFLSGPLTLKSGVTLWIERKVTLYASRNPEDYDRPGGPQTCGTATPANDRSCKPFILASDTSGGGIVGDGAIDGRGGSLLTAGPNAGKRSWWDVAFQNKTDNLQQQNPILVSIKDSRDFTLYRVAILNAPTFHVLPSNVDGMTAWGIRILSPTLEYSRPGYACPTGSTPDVTTPATCFTPETVKNTDGFDPAQSQRVLLAYSFISDGDDNVAVKSHGKRPSKDLAFVRNHFFYGHGMSIGSETDAGLSSMSVRELSIDGYDSAAGIGIRIKSDASRGGQVQDVKYSHICLRNVRQPLVFDTYYRNPDSGERYPSFTNIRIEDLRNLGSARYGGGTLTFAGFDADGQRNPISIELDNVVFDGSQPSFAESHNGAPQGSPYAVHFIFGPRAVSFAPLVHPSTASDVMVSGKASESEPLNCDHAFVPYRSVLAESPI